MASNSIEDLVAHLGLNVDKGSFDSARKALDKLAQVEMQKVIDTANAMAKATVDAMARAGREAKKAAESTKGLNTAWSWLRKGAAAFVAYKIGDHLLSMGQRAIKTGANFGDLADKTGMAVEEIQEWGYAAGIHGLSAEFLTSTVGKLTTTLDKAAKKGGEAAAPFKKAGIAIKDAAGKARPAADVMGDIADRLQSLSEEERPAEAVKLLGKAGRQLIPFLKDGSAGIERLRKESRELGLILSKETVDAMDKAGKNVKRLEAAWEGLKQQAIATLIPAITELTETLLTWYKANKDDITQVIGDVFRVILLIVKALAKGLMVLVKAGAFLGKSWKTLTVILGSLVVALGLLKIHAMGGVAATTKFGIASLKAGIMAAKGWAIALAPVIGLTAAIATVVLAVQDFMVWMRGGKSVMGDIFGKFEDNKWAQSLAFGFETAFAGVKKIVAWIADKAEKLLARAEHLYRGLFKQDEVKAEAQNAVRFGVAQHRIDRLAPQLEAAKKELAANPQDGFAMAKVVSLTRQYGQAVEAKEAAMANLNITNTVNVNGGDPEKVRQVVEEVNAKNARQLEATLGGAKKR